MTGTGGSDGDGGGTRYEKELAANKIIDAKYRANRSSRSGQGGGGASGGCFGSCLVQLVIFSVVINLIMGLALMAYKCGSIAYENFTDVETISDYSMLQYASNVIHLDAKAEFKVKAKVLNCYKNSNEAVKKAKNPVTRLRRGKRFMYRGYTRVDSNTILAVEVVAKKPIYCYVMLPEKWSGKSFWGQTPSKFIREIKKKKP